MMVIKDISRSLITHASTAKKYRVRTKPIKTLFIHHSGVDNKKDGVQTWLAIAGYHVINKKWPGIAYHFGINLRPSYDKEGNFIIYRLNSDDTCCYHTKGCNDTGIGLCLQGHHGNEPLSVFQTTCLEAFIPWWMETYNRDIERDLGWHSNSIKWGGIPKLACPGKLAVKWLKEFRLSHFHA